MIWGVEVSGSPFSNILLAVVWMMDCRLGVGGSGSRETRQETTALVQVRDDESTRVAAVEAVKSRWIQHIF